MIASLQPSRLWRVSIAGIAAAGVGVALAGAAGLDYWAFVIAAALSTVFVPFVMDLRPSPRAPAQPEPRAPAQPEPRAPAQPEPEQESVMRRELIAALCELPPRERSVYMLHRDMGLSVSEVASALKMTVASVNSDLQHASDQLAAAGWDGPERDALAARLLCDIQWAEVGILEIASQRGVRPKRAP